MNSEYRNFTEWLKDNSNQFGETIMSVEQMAKENNLTKEAVLNYLERFEEEGDGWFSYTYFFDTEDMIEYYFK
jgi:hypothetical protein